MVGGGWVLTASGRRSSPLLAGWSPTGLLLEAEASCDDEEIPAYTSTRQCGFLHQEWTTAPECTPVQASGLHQRTPNRGHRPLLSPPGSGQPHQEGSQRRPAGETLDYACVPPIYALPVSWLFNLKMQKSPLVQCTSDTIDTLFCNGWV